MDRQVGLVKANQELQAELTGCQREVELLRSELELSTSILNKVNEIALVLNPKGHIIRCNFSFEQITSYALNEVKNQLFWELCNQDEKELVKAVFGKIQQDKTATAHEHDWITKDGDRRSIAWDYTPCLDSDSAVKYVIGIGNDVTSKTPVERAIQERVAQMEEAPNCLLEARDAARGSVPLRAHNRRAREEAELTVLLEREKAASERAAELAKANVALKQSLDALAADSDLDRFIGYVLKVVADQFDAPVTEYWSHSENIAYLELSCCQGEVITKEQLASDPSIQGIEIPAEMVAYEALQQRQRHFVVKDLLTDPIQLQVFSQLNFDLAAWCAERGVRQLLNVPLRLGEQTIGALTIYIPGGRHFTEQQIELGYALAHQVTLAIHLSQLAEESKQAAVARKQEQAAQEHAAELAKANEELRQRARLLSTVAKISKYLLESPKVNSAIEQALRQIGEASGISRVVLMQERPEADTGRLQHQVLLEWTAAGVPRQIDDPATKVVQNDQYGVLIDELHAGRSTWHMLDELPEPARMQQTGIDVKSTGAVPIFIEDSYYGCVGFDDCVDHRQWSVQEIDVLTSGAGVIGAALHRKQLFDRLIAERIQTEQKRSAKLEKVNEALKRSLDSLASEPSLDKFLGQVLTAIADQLQSPLTEYWYHSEGDIAYIGMMHWQGRVYDREEITAQFPRHPGVDGFHVLPELIYGESLHHRKRYFIVEDWHTHPFIKDAPWRQDWEEVFGIIEKEINVPMVLGDDCTGALVVRLPRSYQITTQQLELAQALAHQATLAVQLTRLAEEAKQAAIAREQEKAATERAAELAKANEMLARTSARLADQPDLSAFLAHITLEAVAQLGADAGHLTILNEQRRTLCTAVHVEQGNVIPITPLAVEMLIDEAGFLQILLETRKPRFFDLEQEAHLFWTGAAEYHRQRNHCAVLSVPLYAGGTFLGHLGLAFANTYSLTDQGAELLQALAHQAALAIQLTRLAEEAKLAAILEERNRIACEIHDTLAQAFGGILVQLQAASYFATTKPDNAQQHLTAARELAHSGLAEARRSVWTLYQEGKQYQELTNTVPQALKQLTAGTSVQANFSIQGIPYNVAPDVGMNLLRIVQESVTNALRHAQAQTIQITLTYASQQVRLSVCDDGCGFEPQLPSQGFGLTSMHQRAEQIGAVLQIISSVGAGTEIQVVMPIC